MDIVGVSEWEYGCACVLTLCHYVGVWSIWLSVSDNDLSLGQLAMSQKRGFVFFLLAAF